MDLRESGSDISLDQRLILAGIDVVFVPVNFKILRQPGRVIRIRVETQPAHGTGIFATPNAFAFPVCHYCFEADFFGFHMRALH
jgi:hypothetical protein